MSPIDYTINVKNPFESAVQGLKTGLGIRQAEQQQAQQQKQHKVIQSLLSKPNASAAEWSNAMLLVPQLKDQFKQAWEVRSQAQQQAALNDLSRWGAAVNNGQSQLAVDEITARADALEASAGGPTQESQALRTNAQIIQQNPNFARFMMNASLAAHPEGGKVIESLNKIGQEQRAQEIAPVEKQIKNADARIKEAQADVAPEKERATIDELKSRVDKVKTELAQASAGGGLDPEKRFDFETKLRKEYNDQTKGYQEVREAFNRISAAEDSGPGDIALIYSYMKMLDPGSVVREGEFATAENSSGIPERIRNMYNKAMDGERLTPGQRKTFIGQAGKLMGAAEKREKTVRSGLDGVVKSYKLNPDNVFYEPSTDAGAPTAQARPEQATAAVSKYANKGWAKY